MKNNIHNFFVALKVRAGKWINKKTERLLCAHHHRSFCYCRDSGLYLYRECVMCDKKFYN